MSAQRDSWTTWRVDAADGAPIRASTEVTPTTPQVKPSMVIAAANPSRPTSAEQPAREAEQRLAAAHQEGEAEQGGAEHEDCDEADGVRHLPARVGVGDQPHLLGLVAALELLRMEQVVEQKQRRSEDERRAGGDPVEAKLRQPLHGLQTTARRGRVRAGCRGS